MYCLSFDTEITSSNLSEDKFAKRLKDANKKLFVATVFVTAKDRKQSRSPSLGTSLGTNEELC